MLALAVAAAGPCQAHPAVEQFSKCLADNTTGKDRKAFARWLFVAMGAHAEMKAISQVAPSATETSSREAGELLTKLLVEACPAQARAAVDAAGPGAIQSAFAVVGQLAMQELMTDANVQAAAGAMQKHLDTKRLEAVLGQK